MSNHVSHASNWSGHAISRANRIYFVVALGATLVVFLLPRLLGGFIPCASYMEIDWSLVALLSLVAIGILNVLFAFLAAWEAAVPTLATAPLRKALVIVLPCLALVGIVWFAVGAFVPALLNDPELLCD